MTVAVCVGVLALSLYVSWRLGQFIRRCDERQEYVIIDIRKESVVAEAEQITREAAQS